MKILSLQLPLIDNGYNYVDGNVQYAPSIITAFINKNGFAKASYLNESFINFVSDQVIIKYIINSNINIVCFTAFVWNIERVLKISQQIKKLNSSIIIFIGGSEIHEDSYALSIKREYVDFFIKGEAEFFFYHFFNERFMSYISEISLNKLFIQPSDSFLPNELYIEPFTSNYLNVGSDGSIFVELTRGCPYRCIYCNYSNSYNTVRNRSTDILKNALKKASLRNVSEVYILSPTFDSMPSYKELLKDLNSLNISNIRLHSELRPEKVTPETARLLYKAGFRSLEIGVQTFTQKTLDTIGRRVNTYKVQEGIKNLLKADIALKIGVIPGLPFDTVDSFKECIDILIALGFGDYIEYYPLLLLPGTAIRQKTEAYGITYQSMPPYYFISSETFNHDDVLEMKEYIEDKTGFYNITNIVPDLIANSESNLYKGCFIDFDNCNSFNINVQHINTTVYNYYIKVKNINDILSHIDDLLDKRESLINIVIFSDTVCDEVVLLKKLEKLLNDSFVSRLNIYNDWVEQLGVKIFQITSVSELYTICDSQYNFIEPFLLLDDKQDFSLYEENPQSIVIDKNYYSQNNEYFKFCYNGYPEKISFIDYDNYLDFHKTNDSFKSVPQFNILNFQEMVDKCLKSN